VLDCPTSEEVLDGDHLEGVSGTPTLAEFLLEMDTDGFLILPEGRPSTYSHAQSSLGPLGVR
jgi:hypothetical protein